MQRRGVFAFFCLRGYTKLGYADPEATCEAGGPSGMTIKTADEFFAVLEKSRLLEAKQLVEARRVAAEVENPEDATAVAKALARQGLISHWQAGLLLAGRTLFFMGKYKLIRKLGRAGGGSVFLGQHVTMNRRVALKFISRQMGKDRDSLDRFLAEARAIATLDHPNIVRAYSVDNEGDRYYLVMEYIDGLDLQQLVEREGRLDCGLAADYIRQAAEGLAHAHAHNMVHGAVRPCHLLVSRQGVVKIRDVGLSRLVEGDGGGPRPEQGAAGPAGYLAPEQAGGGGEVDCRSDIYGLGCTLYLLLTGHAPSAEAASAERGGQRQSQLSGDIRRQRPDAPAPLADLCAKMMAAPTGESPPVGRGGQSCLGAVGGGQRAEGGRGSQCTGGGRRSGRGGSGLRRRSVVEFAGGRAHACRNFAAEERTGAGGQGGAGRQAGRQDRGQGRRQGPARQDAR